MGHKILSGQRLGVPPSKSPAIFGSLARFSKRFLSEVNLGVKRKKTGAQSAGQV
jgi:hypothetical protein